MHLSEDIKRNMAAVIEFSDQEIDEVRGSKVGDRMIAEFDRENQAWADMLATNGVPNDENTNAIAAVVLQHITHESNRIAMEKGVMIPLAAMGEIGALMLVVAKAYKTATEVGDFDWDAFARDLMSESQGSIEEEISETEIEQPRRFTAGTDGIEEG